MSGDTELQRIARIIAISEANVLRFIDAELRAHFHHLKEFHLTPIEQATADTAQRVSNLAAEVASANTKVDKLIALALANGVPQADIDAITAIGAAADAATSQLQAEETKVDAALGANAPAPAPSAPSGASDVAA